MEEIQKQVQAEQGRGRGMATGISEFFRTGDGNDARIVDPGSRIVIGEFKK